MAIRSLVVLVVVATACTASTPTPLPAAARLAVAPPLVTPDGQLRFVTTPTNDVQAEDVGTGTVRWKLSPRIPATAPAMRWRIVVSDDGSSVYIQSVSDDPGLRYLGTQRIEARTGAELANDFKDEIYWYQNVVLWTAFTRARVLMAVERPAAGGGGYWLRTLDPLTLKILTSVPTATPPAGPGP
jgi:hypothetical protein